MILKKNIKITNKEVKKFCKLTRDNNPIHLNKKYAAGTRFKTTIVPGILILTKINTILSKKFSGAIILDISADYRFPIKINENYNCKYRIIKKKSFYELNAEIYKKNKNAVIKISFLN